MSERKFIQTLEEIMDLDEGELEMDSKLDDFDEWDSLSALGLTVYAKKNLGKILTTEKLQTFVYVKDIFDFVCEE